MNGKELRAARIALGLTRRDLADLLLVTARTVQSWELGDRDVSGPAEVALRLYAKYPAEIKQRRRPDDDFRT